MSYQVDRVGDFKPNTVMESAVVDAELDVLVAGHNAHDAATGTCHGLDTGDGAIAGTKKTQTIANKLYAYNDLSGSNTKGKVYKFDPATRVMSLASPLDVNIEKYDLVFGTGVAGEGAYAGVMTGLTSILSGITPPQTLFLHASGVVKATMPSSGAIIRCAKMVSTDEIRIAFSEGEGV